MINNLFKLVLLFLVIPFEFLALNLDLNFAEKNFVWSPNSRLDDTSNWLNKEVPCEDDSIRFDGDSADEKISILSIDGPLKVRVLEFPENGVVFFGDNTILGDNAKRNWQCKRRENPQEVFFVPKVIAPNFFDLNNWKIQGNYSNRPRIDAENVPSDQDNVIFPVSESTKVFLNEQAKVKSLNFSNRLYTTKDMFRKMYTVEGQFIFRLGPRLRADINIDNISVQFPSDRPFLIGHKSSEGVDRIKYFGQMNSNTFVPQFTQVCQFVKCPKTEGICEQPINPTGQCCPTCGAFMTFRQTSLNFTLSLAIVREFEDDFLAEYPNIGISFLRLDNDVIQPLYQLAVLPHDLADYSESLFYTVLWDAFDKIQQQMINAHWPIKYQPSSAKGYFDLREFYSIESGKIHWGRVFKNFAFFLLLLGIVALAFRQQYKRSPRFRLFVSRYNSPSIDRMVVGWQRARERVDLLRTVGNQRRRLSSLIFVQENVMSFANPSEERDIFHAEFTNQAFIGESASEKETNE